MKDKETRVLLIYPWLVVGGTVALFSPVVEALKRRGFSFSAISTRDTLPNMGSTKADLLAAGCEDVQELTELAGSEEEVRALFWEILEKGNFDTLVIIGSTLAYEQLSEIKKRFPKMHIVDQLFADTKHVKSNQELNKFIDVTVVPSQLLADRVKQGLTERHAKLTIIPHGLKVPTQGELRAAKEAGAAQLPQAAGKFVIAYFARLAKEKGPDLFVQLASRLRDLPDAFFLMVGDGPDRDKIQSLIAEEGLENKIYAPGFVENIDPLMSVADLVLVPSRMDGQPLVILHTMAHAKPVIACSTGSVPIMVKNGETGYLCQVEDLESFITFTVKLYENRQLARSMGEAGYRHFLANFDNQKMIERYEAILQPGSGYSGYKGMLSRLLSLVGA